MKLQYKHQQFQEDAARAVTDCFNGQPCYSGVSNFSVNPGLVNGQPYQSLFAVAGFANAPIQQSVPLRDNIRQVQIKSGLKPTGTLNKDPLTLTIEMETGTGKTFTYIKTMYELNRLYGWTKFVVVVPSIAIREGVLSSFRSMEDYFANEYDGKRIQYFVYNSKQLSQIDTFASDAGMHVMIINMQAFNSSFDEEKNKVGRGGDAAARIIFSQRDEFRSRRPIDIIAATRPIMIIDEPQSVLGANKQNQTRKGLDLFHPLFKLLYSATHRPNDIVNLVYRLDAIDAYNQHLVKKIEVVGVEQVGTTATNGYLYLENIIISKGAPQARINFDVIRKDGTLTQQSRIVKEGDDLYTLSNKLEEYHDNFVIERIDGRDGTLRLRNGITLQEGQIVGSTNTDLIRRIQIRETIRKHIEREQQLYPKHIKVLSLFFIDHVASYRLYGGTDPKGPFAKMFEEEYQCVLGEVIQNMTDSGYKTYLQDSLKAVGSIHQGYFSQDKKTGHLVDPKTERGSDNSSDESAYDLIMKDKERLLSLSEPVRFIFSHSALKEGWDNPNVFQICTLKDSNNEIKKRQEVGRGMRLCVNGGGIRQDATTLGSKDAVFDTNILTVIASESYESFAAGLQHEIAEACPDRPQLVTNALFVGAEYTDGAGVQQTISEADAVTIQETLVKNDYIDGGKLTQKYYEAKDAGILNLGKMGHLKDTIVRQLDGVYEPSTIANGRKSVEGKFDKTKFTNKFEDLWKKINFRSYYTVNFNSKDLIESAIEQLKRSLSVTQIDITISTGKLEKIADKTQLESGTAMKQGWSQLEQVYEPVGNVRYDLIGQLVARTGLTRKTIVAILNGIKNDKLTLFKSNPEEFIMKAARIINSCKATLVANSANINYEKNGNTFSEDIFTTNIPRGIPGNLAMVSTKSLYSLVVVDSNVEMNFAEKLENQNDVEVYTKLPRGFYINTPMGHYNPDWAVVFKEANGVKHIYFVVETKGSTSPEDLRPVENAKIACAKKHFGLIPSTDDVKYEVVTSWVDLYNKAR